MKDASIQGEDENQSLVTDKLDSHCKGEQESPKGNVHTPSSDEDNTPLAKMIPKRLCSRLSQAFGKPTTSVDWSHKMATPIRVSRAVQRELDEALLTRSTKKSRAKKSKFVPPVNPIDIIDDAITEPKKDKKRKRSSSIGSSKKQVPVSKPVKKSNYTDDSDGDMVVSAETCKARILAFKKRKVIRGRVVTGIGGHEMGELLVLLQAQGWVALFLQGNRRRKMGRKETREFYINVIGSASSISSKVGGVSFTLDAEVLSKILGVPNVGWGHYVKRTWPPLEGLSSALEISRRFAHDPMLEGYTRVDKGAMLPLHKPFFMICVHDDKDHGLGYGFWGANAPVQRLKVVVTTNNEEIAALRVTHSAAMDQLHISYGISMLGWLKKTLDLRKNWLRLKQHWRQSDRPIQLI
ncbi:hypothetical protein KY290_021693 [Solanum tuberosum]|uniref:Uncharacterized protein n=1 Tax=Solanum tuberosum TaxID=4113 RepID=A0ABQ7V5E5_SOLTU|nr:hypothetical protein KY284_020715 [Solanum tuberosum]KAH0683103.1 hypothetical protein KY289_020855 [Solanum tuberosum]KAH0758200.1 hypothetical protein KY290_021693 [Solanum tuberosum]